MFTGFLIVLFWIVCALIVAVVLMQSGKGAGFAGAFGSGGGSQTAFGARAGSFLTRLTAGLAATVMVLSFLLVMIGSSSHGGGKAPDEVATPAKSTAKQPADWVEKSGVANDIAGGGQTADKSAPADTSTASPDKTGSTATDNAAGSATTADKSAPADTSTASPDKTGSTATDNAAGSATTKPAESAPVQPQ